MYKPKILALALLLCFTFSIISVSSIQVANAFTFTYEASISPTSAYVGQVTTYTITIRDTGDGTGNDGLGSVDIAFPTGYAVNPAQTLVVSASASKTWLGSFISNGVHLRSLGDKNTLVYGETVSVTFVATNPVTEGRYQWLTNATTNSGQGGTSYLFQIIGDYPITSNEAATFTVALFPSPVAAGTVGSFVVAAKDSLGNTAVSYTGTVHFTSSDPQSNLPSDYQFTSSDAGVHTFTAALKTAGIQSITATDTNAPSITGSQTNIIVNPGPATYFVVGAPSTVTVNAPFDVALTAKDSYQNTVTDYAGTVSFTSSSAGNLPANSQLPGGSATFSNVVLLTSGSQTITATDTVSSSITGTTGLTVTNDLMAQVNANPMNAAIGQTIAFTASAYGGYGSYTYQWYNGGIAVADVAGTSYSVTPASAGSVDVYVRVTDSASNTATSTTISVPVSQLTITASAGAGGSITPSGTINANFGQDSPIFSITPNPGYSTASVTIDGANNIGAVSSYQFTNIQTSHTISATFTQDQYTLTVNVVGTGCGVTKNPDQATYTYSSTVALTPVAAQGWTFSSWSSNVVADSITINSNTIVTATFVQNTYAITPSVSGPGGSISPNNPQTVNQGTTPTFTVSAQTGYHLLDLAVDGTSVMGLMIGNSYTFAPVNANHAIVATFTVNQYTITASAGPNGAINPSGATTVNYGTSQLYTFTPNSNYQVANVIIDGITYGPSGSYTFVNVQQSHTIAVTFELNTPASTPTPTPTPTATPTQSPNPSPSPTPTTTPTPVPTATPTPIPTTNPTLSPTATPTPEPTPTQTPIPTPTPTPISIFTPTTSPTANPTSTPTSTQTPQPTSTPSSNPTTTASPNYSPTPTPSLTPTTSSNSTPKPSPTPNTPSSTSPSQTTTATPASSPAENPNPTATPEQIPTSLYTVGLVAAALLLLLLLALLLLTLLRRKVTINATAGPNGAITPIGQVRVKRGADQTFVMAGHFARPIADVLVDGKSVGSRSTFTFKDVRENHTIRATFEA